MTIKRGELYYADLSPVVGSAEISCPAFREGSWKYSTFENGLKLTDEDSASGCVTKYSYDENDV